MSATRNLASLVSGRMRLHPFYVLVAFGSVFCLIVMTSTAWMLWQQRISAIAAAGTNLQNLSRAVADQTDRVIQSVTLAEDRLLDHMTVNQDEPGGVSLGMTGSKRLHVVMRDIIAGLSEAFALVLVDAAGNLVNFTNQYPIPTLNVADRPYFQFALAHPEEKSFISETEISRQTNVAAFYIIRRLTGPDGAFAGLLMGAVQVDYLDRLFGASTLPTGGIRDTLSPKRQHARPPSRGSPGSHCWARNRVPCLILRRRPWRHSPDRRL